MRRRQAVRSAVWFGLLSLVTAGLSATGRVSIGDVAVAAGVVAACLGVEVVVHEMAHAVIARVVGFKLHWVRVGSGPRLAHLSVGGVELRVHALPWGGFTAHTPTGGRWIRLRQLAVTGAGVAANLGLGLAALRLLSGPWLVAGVMTSFLAVARNAYPHIATGRDGQFRSDGARFLLFLRMPGWKLELATSTSLADAVRLVRAHRYGEGLAAAERCLATCRHRVVPELVRNVALIELGRPDEAREGFRKLLNEKRCLPAELRPEALNGFAYASLLCVEAGTGDAAVLAEANAASAEAHRLRPDSAAILDTRALAVLAAGQPAQAIPFARRALHRIPPGLDRARVECTLARALAATGDLDQASKYLQRAATVLPADDRVRAKTEEAVSQSVRAPASR